MTTVAPHNLEAEAALLGGLIIDARQLDNVADVVGQADFYRPDHARLFGLLLDMRNAGHHIDEMTVGDRVSRGGKSDDYGGYAYVLDLPEKCPSRTNLPAYARMVREAAVRRRAIRVAEASIERLSAGLDEPEAVLSETSATLLAEIDGGDRERGWQSAGDVAERQLAEVQRRGQGRSPALSTGFFALDEMLNGGLRPGQLVVIAARPGVGKTALAITMAFHAAATSGVGAGVFSLEMDAGELVERVVSQAALVDASKIRRGDLSDVDWSDVEVARDLIGKSLLFIDDRAGVTVEQIRARARRLCASQPIGLLVVDYLQLLTPTNARSNRADQVGEMSRGLKLLAKELRVPVVALSQLNRDIEKRKGEDARPKLSDLRDSGAVEQDADIIMFIGRNETDPTGAAHTLHVAKNRSGRIGDVGLVFEKAYSRFVEPDGFRL